MWKVKMASIEKITQANADSEMEEGEIVDDLDDLSDISSEEEFLLRQRLEVLEDYNNVLGRTKKKRSSEINPMRDLLCDLSEISAAEIDETKLYNSYHPVRESKNLKQYSKPKRKKEASYKHSESSYIKRKKDYKKKINHSRKKPIPKVISESSDESEDEYRNKRRKLADAVVGHRGKTDTSTLSARLKKMLYKSEDLPVETNDLVMYQDNNNQRNSLNQQFTASLDSIDEVDCGVLKNATPQDTVKESITLCEEIDLLTSDDDDIKLVSNNSEQPHILDNVSDEPKPTLPEPKLNEAEGDSDEDLAQLRQQVLRTKALKANPVPETKIPSDDEDSDTAELRLICLKSTLLKRAIEMKQKQKLQKKLSQSTLEDDIFNDEIFFPSKHDSGNNTDIESMDMDMGSDVDEKVKDGKDENKLKKTEADERLNNNNHTGAIASNNKEDELDEDEDLLRAKLLTSLSKNLPNLVSPELLNTIDENKNNETNAKNVKSVKKPETKRFIIKLDESDSEGEHEATKNLTKMHMKLSEQTDFQQKLDLFLKSTRMQVEKNTRLPDVVQKQATPKKPEKYVAKTVKHLPKSEQIEYKNLVRRMAELEKMKQLRQVSLNSAQPLKETLKPINSTVDANLEEKISISRKKIADESAKMLKLKDEATKLTQKFKIVSNELHNISTAITLNKKQQRAVQNCLHKIRLQHQTLIKSSSTSLHSKVNGNFNNFTNKVTSTNKLQKENTPKDEYKNVVAQKTVKISVVNDLNKNSTNTNPRLSVEVNVASNKKVVKVPSPEKEKRIVISVKPISELMDLSKTQTTLERDSCDIPQEERDERSPREIENEIQKYSADDYRSPLDAFGKTSWESDPNAILCPFDVGGQCRDSDCKYLHTHSEQ